MVRLIDNKKRSNDHWWPIGLQTLWTNENDQVRRRRNHSIDDKNPKNKRTGCQRRAHFFDVGDSPWTHNFENAFQVVDTKGAVVVQKSVKFIKETVHYKLCRWRFTRWLSHYSKTVNEDIACLSQSDLHHLTRLIVSIVIRSPAQRFKMSLPSPATPAGTPISPAQGQLNLWLKWVSWYQNDNLPTFPVSVVFFIGHWSTEFVIGDGFHQTFLDGPGWPNPIKGYVIFPLSPDICVLLKFNSRDGQRLVDLSKEQTRQMNKITCQSSRNEIYFRHQDQPQFQPAALDVHRSVKLEEHNFLSKWIDC